MTIGKQEEDVSFIRLIEPNAKVSGIACSIESQVKKGMIKSIKDLNDLFKGDDLKVEAEKQKENRTDDEAYMASYEMICSSADDMGKVVLHFRELFKHCALGGGEKVLNDTILDRINHKDFSRMMGAYYETFLVS